MTGAASYTGWRSCLQLGFVFVMMDMMAYVTWENILRLAMTVVLQRHKNSNS